MTRALKSGLRRALPAPLGKLVRPVKSAATVRAESEAEGLRDELRAAGLRATASRVAVLGLLRRATAPMSHQDAIAALAGQGWDRATLYRNLLDLTRRGLARRADLGDHVWRFETSVVGGHRAEEHPHFVCDLCGNVECLNGLTVVTGRGARSPKAVREKRVAIQVKGVCDRCA